jgi:hypothetical protein
VLRDILNAVPVSLLVLAAVALALGVVVLAVWLIRRTVPATREGFHAENSAPMLLGSSAALFGLLLAFVIIIAYENFLEASADVSPEADSLASIACDSAVFPEPEGDRVRRRENVCASGRRRRMGAYARRQRQPSGHDDDPGRPMRYRGPPRRNDRHSFRRRLAPLGRLADRIGLVATAGSRAPSSATSSPTISPRGVVGEATVDDADEPVGESS